MGKKKSSYTLPNMRYTGTCSLIQTLGDILGIESEGWCKNEERQ
jgi:hypothetical protein